MKKLLILAAITIFSCTHRSELLHESGVVVDKVYSPEFDGNGMGTGFSTSGNLTVSSVNVHKKEQFVIVFKCQHGTVFTINQKSLYYKLDKGDTVSIDYYNKVNRRGTVKDYEFVDANKINPAPATK